MSFDLSPERALSRCHPAMSLIIMNMGFSALHCRCHEALGSAFGFTGAEDS